LRLGRDHSEQSAKGPVSFCSISKQSDRQKLVHSQHENEPVHVTRTEAGNVTQLTCFMMTPTTAELRTAIEVLKMLDKHINDHAAHSVAQLPNTELGDRYAAHIEARTIEQVSPIEKVSTQLKNWRDELLQAPRQKVSQSV
jgi:hypothetical protein